MSTPLAQHLVAAFGGLPLGGPVSLRVTGRLACSPYAGSLYAAELASLPAIDTHEYGHLAALERATEVPVLVSWSQHYRFLAELVRLARVHLDPAPLMLVRHAAPNHLIPLPPDLLAADVLLTQDPGALVPRLRSRGRMNLLSIEDSLRRDGHEDGTNSLSIALYGAPQAGPFIDYIRATPLAHCLTDLDLECF